MCKEESNLYGTDRLADCGDSGALCSWGGDLFPTIHSWSMKPNRNNPKLSGESVPFKDGFKPRNAVTTQTLTPTLNLNLNRSEQI